MEKPFRPCAVKFDTFDQDEHVYAALRAAVRGFQLKESGPELLAQAIRAAAHDEALIAPSDMSKLGVGNRVEPTMWAFGTKRIGR